MIDRAVLVSCRKCSKKFPSNEFILDPVYRMMVCRNCSRERIAKDSPEAKARIEEQNKKPAGWDNDDESAAKQFQRKQAEQPVYKKVAPDKVKVICPKCRFAFIFNTDKRYPLNCPQCGTRAVR